MFDLRAVVGVRAGDHPARALLDPAERRDVVVVTQQDAGLAGAGLRRQIGLPPEQPVAPVGEPACHVRRAAGLHGPAQDRERQAVDLEEQDPGRVGGDRLGSTSRHPSCEAECVGVVVVDACDGAGRRAHRRGEDRDCERVGEAVDGQLVGEDVGGDHQDHRVEGEHEEEADEDGEREPQRGHDRRQEQRSALRRSPPPGSRRRTRGCGPPARFRRPAGGRAQRSARRRPGGRDAAGGAPGARSWRAATSNPTVSREAGLWQTGVPPSRGGVCIPPRGRFQRAGISAR